ncbi:hypothetical protein [Rhodovulum sp. 12E13]|uniref:hypothetical protein n=1 Tax=Rhodovulum sp. 12E13 TaxID=2203891 RepID=UPI001F25D2DB|nr:hypothetical protein [Rhodovulum sp. 12E13]
MAAVLADLERAGGWRRFMRDASDAPDIAALDPSPEEIGAFPQAVLGAAFYKAKMGDPGGARRLLQSVDATFGPEAECGADLLSDRLLVEAHVAVYEDKAFRAADAFNLRRVLRWWA